jgi:hypothetical protein
MQKLFVQFNVPNNPMKHWYGEASWEMIDYMHKQVLKRTQSDVDALPSHGVKPT